jgi:catechol 2,3-dioxygenase-like lactoylglutathione lyase family enzyme
MRSPLILLLVGLTGCASRPSTIPVQSEHEASEGAASVTEVAITVSNLAESTNFFMYELEAALMEKAVIQGSSFERLTGIEGAEAHVQWVTIGEERIALRQFMGEPGEPVRSGAASNDLDFQHLALVVADMDRAHEQVRAAKITPVSIGGPQTIPLTNPAAGGIRAFYFRDPDGHPLELIWYPSGKGAARWQRQGEALFLGIDHTAIAVSNTARSQAFYEALGLAVAGRSLNSGIEQENLSGVPSARVQITGLRGRDGFGVEFLEYLSPAGGLAPERGASPRDIGFYETTILVPDLDATLERVESLGVERISSGVGRCGKSCLEGGRAVVVRDPDGHALRIVEAP